MIANGQRELALRTVAGHSDFGQGNDGGTVQVNGHTTVRTVFSSYTIDGNILQVGADDLTGNNVIENEPRAVAAEIHRTTAENRVVVRCDVDVYSIAAVNLFVVQLTVVHLIHALGILVVARAVGLACLVPRTAHDRYHRELSVTALALVVIDADIICALLSAIDAHIAATILLIGKIGIAVRLRHLPAEAVGGRFRL